MRLIKDERGSVGIYILAGVFIFCIVFATVYWAVAQEALNIRSYAIFQIQQAGKFTLAQSVSYDLPNQEFVISMDKSDIEKIFKQRIALNHYSITNFLVLNKGDTDPWGYKMAQPGFYIQLDLPIAGFHVPVAQDILMAPYNSETKIFAK